MIIHMENTIKAMPCQSVENISRRNENKGTPTKKHQIFLVPVWRF